MSLKESTYREKFSGLLKPWMPSIVATIKRDLKQGPWIRKYAPSKPSAKLTVEELQAIYSKAVAEDEEGEGIGAWMAQSWLLKKTDLYAFFKNELTMINPEFDLIEEIERSKASEIVEKGVTQFGAPDMYLFTVINAVVFPEDIVRMLSERADAEVKNAESKKQAAEVEKSAEKMAANHELQIARLTDKYEKKLQGFEKKYLDDTESLKKQIALLQKRLNTCAGTTS